MVVVACGVLGERVINGLTDFSLNAGEKILIYSEVLFLITGQTIVADILPAALAAAGVESIGYGVFCWDASPSAFHVVL